MCQEERSEAEGETLVNPSNQGVGKGRGTHIGNLEKWPKRFLKIAKSIRMRAKELVIH